MIIDKLLEEKNLTSSEKSIAKFLLDKNNDLENLTSLELGKRSFTSQSAVMRLSKKLGMKTYREFLSKLIVERNEYFKVNEIDLEQPRILFSSYETTQKAVVSLYTQIITNTNLQLDKNTIIRICNRLMSASSVDIYATGISHTLAHLFSYKLQSIGILCTFQDGCNPFYIENIQDAKTRVSIVFLLEDINTSNTDLLQHLHKKDIYTIVISEKKDVLLLDFCDDCISVDVVQNEQGRVMSSIFSSYYIIDLIFSIVKYRKFGDKLP